MSAPYDRPAYGDPGGCECLTCGVIFIGAPWHDECGLCAAKADRSPQGQDRETELGPKGDGPTVSDNEPGRPKDQS